MAQFRKIILDYLEVTEPEKYRALREGGQLFSTVMLLSEEMVEAALEVAEELRASYPSMSAIEVDIQAEAIVISDYLPTMGSAAEDIASLREAGAV